MTRPERVKRAKRTLLAVAALVGVVAWIYHPAHTAAPERPLHHTIVTDRGCPAGAVQVGLPDGITWNGDDPVLHARFDCITQ